MGAHSACQTEASSKTDVPGMAALRYRAFLSYSHRDTAWARWLHRALEGYRIDKDLVGRDTPRGPIPKTLWPIFRDREDFAAGHSLTEQTLAALEASQFLIVICSPNAAQSQYVNEEIRRFKKLGRSARVIPIIVDGEPGDSQRECFPAAVRFKIGPDGALTNEREEPVAADARPQKDGREIAKQKVVAGLLAIGLDEILRRAERARKRRNIIRVSAAGVALVVVMGGVVGWIGGLSATSRLKSAEVLNNEHIAADLCDRASQVAMAYQVPEARRIALAFQCVDVLNEGLAGLPQDSYLPANLRSTFEANLAVLRKYKETATLTPEQSDVLTNAETAAAKLGLD
jgi:TIR domain